MPIGLEILNCRSLSSVRKISLTRSGVSTNLMFDSVIDDLVKSCTDGADGTDANRNKYVIFIEVVGFVADYTTSSYVPYLYLTKPILLAALYV